MRKTFKVEFVRVPKSEQVERANTEICDCVVCHNHVMEMAIKLIVKDERGSSLPGFAVCSKHADVPEELIGWEVAMILLSIVKNPKQPVVKRH